MRDKQRSKVYAWENAASWSGKSKNELDDTQVLHIIKQLDTKLKRKPTTVKFSNRRHQNATAQTWGNIITLPRSWARCWSVVLHEYAHLLADEHKHGPVFVTTFCALLKNFHPDKPTYKELSASLRERNIDFKSLQDSKYEKKCKRIKITLTNVKKPKDYDFLENTSVRVPIGRSSTYYTKGKTTRVEWILREIQDVVQDVKGHTELGRFSSVKAKYLIENVQDLTVGDIKYLIKTGRLIAKDSC
tara:strand:+ start:233 stop:967 length:735 start_codon:yes stop_codon:yes gene_type:complete